jgi:hypothetical protein
MELAERLTAAAAQQGALAGAVEDILRRGEQRFSLPPSDDEVRDWMATLKVTAPFFFAQTPPPPPSLAERERQAVLDRLSPEEKLARYRREHPTAPRQRPQRVELTPEQQRELASLPPARRLAAYRALQQGQGKG